jgi:PPOX class probable F420-dependent enzyme
LDEVSNRTVTHEFANVHIGLRIDVLLSGKVGRRPYATVLTMDLPDRLVELMRGGNPCFITTLMPDGSPQTTQTWVDTDGAHVIINTVQTHQKVRNIERDPRVSVAVCDDADTSRYYAVRGRVTNMATEGGAEHIEVLAQRYTGGPYQWYGGRDQVRVILTITAERIHSMDR